METGVRSASVTLFEISMSNIYLLPASETWNHTPIVKNIWGRALMIQHFYHEQLQQGP